MPNQRNALRIAVMIVLFLVVMSENSFSNRRKDRVARDFQHADMDGDSKLSRDEWKRRGNFDKLDKNKDGKLSLNEVRRIYKDHSDRDYNWPPENMAKRKVEIDKSVRSDRVIINTLDDETVCGIARLIRCDIKDQMKRGMVATGTGPSFPANANCLGIDDYWAMDYTHKRRRATFHGGIDIPAPWGTPIRDVAAGSVVAMFQAAQSQFLLPVDLLGPLLEGHRTDVGFI